MQTVNGIENIVFVAGIHGDEQMPIKALKDSGIQFILGNPRAYQRKVRFIDKDLNASFFVEENSYESGQAQKLMKEIKEDNLVVDFHTTSAVTPPFAIVVDEGMISLAERTGLEFIVFMKHNIKKGYSLINYRSGISVETGGHNSKESYRTTIEVVKNIKNNKKYPTKIYEVYGKITNQGKYKNFQKHSEGFIPVLAGETSYNFYGLKAKRYHK